MQLTRLRVSDKYYAVGPLEDGDASLLVKYLARNSIELKANIEAMNLAKLKRKQVKVESTFGLCINGDHVANILWIDCLMYVMKVGGFATQANSIIDDLTVNFSLGHVY